MLNPMMKELPQQSASPPPKKKGPSKGTGNSKEAAAVKAEDSQRIYVQEFLRVLFLRNPEGIAIWDQV